MKLWLYKILFWFFLLTGAETVAQSVVSNTDEAKVPLYTLPEVLQMRGGQKVQTKEEWIKIQRPYIYRLFEENQFGKYPSVKIPVRFKLLENDAHALNGRATRKQVRLFLHPTDSSVYTDVLIYLPNKTVRPVPVFLGLNFSGNHTVANDKNIILSTHWLGARAKGAINNRATDSSRATDTGPWQLNEIISSGYGLVTAYYGDFEPDFAGGWQTGIRTTLKDVLKLQPDAWGAMGAWAYGLGCIMNYLQTDKGIDARKVALIGHSRLGKAALWAAASDQRFSIIISNESGEGGATLSKRWFGETVKIINEKFPWWFAQKYKTYGDNTAALPMDGHMLLALVAPRPLYVASAEGDTWSDPKGEFLSAREAGKVYKLFGRNGIHAAEAMPPLHHPVGDDVRYHIRQGRHDVTLYDWQQYLQFAKDHWK